MADTLEAMAAEIGREHGKNAGTWVIDGNTSQVSIRGILKGIEEGDPMVLDAFNPPNLSGEFADSYSERQLAADLGIDPDADPDESGLSDAADAYNQAASDGFWDEVERSARAMLADE